MGVSPEILAKMYPCLYHMAEHGSWESIQKYGLLSTSRLLDLFRVTPELRRAIELQKRENSFEIEREGIGRAVIRDQKPIVESKLRGCLRDCNEEDWYRLLNNRVFFWLDVNRLYTLLSAREYRNNPHTVLTLDTKSLATAYAERVTLTPMNTGNTLPIAHPRGRATFSRMEDYPFEERIRRGPYYTVVELAVEGGVQDIIKHTIRVDSMISDGEHVSILQNLYKG